MANDGRGTGWMSRATPKATASAPTSIARTSGDTATTSSSRSTRTNAIDRFIQEQIAGDELWPDDPQARIATAFSRHYPDEWNARDLMQRRQEILQDVTDAVGSAFMGLTFGCAKCHDHKFDPILHRDYYRLQAFFANTANDDRIPVWSPEKQRRGTAQIRRVGPARQPRSARRSPPC